MVQSSGHVRNRTWRQYPDPAVQHFAHKIEVSHGDGHGGMPFPVRPCRFWKPTAHRADDPGWTRPAYPSWRGRAVIDDHLARFAFHASPSVPSSGVPEGQPAFVLR